MGQIQSAINGAVSSIVGATVAGELKTQRETKALASDVGKVADLIEDYKKSEDAFIDNTKKMTAPMRQNSELSNLTTEQYADMAKKNNPEVLKADKALQREYDNIMTWKNRIQTRLDSLKRRNAHDLDLEISIKDANKRISAVEASRGNVWDRVRRNAGEFNNQEGGQQ
jgi:hypothetical protein